MPEEEEDKKSHKKDFFISYRNVDPDSHWAQWIACVLEEAGYQVIIYSWDFKPGSHFISSINQALKEAARVIIVLSPKYFESIYTEVEWTAAYSEMIHGKKKPLMLFRIEDFEVEGLLGSIFHIDLFGLSDNEAMQRVLDAVKDKRRKERTSFPDVGHFTAKIKPRFPGMLPEIWNVSQRIPHFTGRGEYLKKIEEIFNNENRTQAYPVVVHGPGGIGKTSLAIEFAYRHLNDYDCVWWVRSGDSATLASDFAELSTSIGLQNEDGRDPGREIKPAGNWLERTDKKWLLIFDDAEKEWRVNEYVPKGGIGDIIITTCNSGWGSGDCIELEKWSREDAQEYIVNRTRQDDKESSSSLAEALEDYPIAITQATAYMISRKKTLAGYLELYKKHRLVEIEKGKFSEEYGYSFVTTWEMSYQEIEKESPVSVEFLKLIACFKSEHIPLFVFRDGKVKFPKPLSGIARNEVIFDDVLGPLISYSLVTMGSDSLSVNRLVQELTRDRMDEKEKSKYLKICTKCESAVQTQKQKQSIPGYETISTHHGQPPAYDLSMQKSKMVAGLLGIFLGCLGIHNFYLGFTGKGVVQLLITVLSFGWLAGVSGLWGLFEGIMILTGAINRDGRGIPLKD